MHRAGQAPHRSGQLNSNVRPHMTDRGSSLEIHVDWVDETLREVTVIATSKRFSGLTNAYIGPQSLVELADCIHGFPMSRADRRTFRIGDPNCNGYCVADLVLFCRDSTGHLAIEVSLRETPGIPGEPVEAATVIVLALPADIDNFEAQLRAVSNVVGFYAVLKSAA